MSKSKFLTSALFLVPMMSFAQDLTSTTTESTPATPVFAPVAEPTAAAAPASVAAAPSATVFDGLRGDAYYHGAFGNQAASFTVGDYIAWPHLMGGNKFLYVEPAAESGTVAADLGGKTAFLSLDNNAYGQGVFTVGLAAKDAWGAAIRMGKDFNFSKSEPKGGNASSVTTVGAGDQIGALFSMKMGDNALGVTADWYTAQDERSFKGSEKSYDQYVIDVKYSNFHSGKPVIWTAGLGFNRLNLSVDTVGFNAALEDSSWTKVDPASNSDISLYFNLGGKILGNETSRVLLGLDNNFHYIMRDDVKNVLEDRSTMSLVTAPNLVGEFAFNENWLVFGGATHSITLFQTSSETDVTVGAPIPPSTAPSRSETTNSTTIVQSQQTTAAAGLRYQKDNLAAEVGLSDVVFEDGPSTLFQGTGVLISFGAFLYF